MERTSNLTIALPIYFCTDSYIYIYICISGIECVRVYVFVYMVHALNTQNTHTDERASARARACVRPKRPTDGRTKVWASKHIGIHAEAPKPNKVNIYVWLTRPKWKRCLRYFLYILFTFSFYLIRCLCDVCVHIYVCVFVLYHGLVS